MSNDVQDIEQAIRTLPRHDIEQLREWIENFLEDELELTDEFKASIERGKQDSSRKHPRARTLGRVSRATEVYSREFDSVLLILPDRIRSQVEAKVHDLGSRLTVYPHQIACKVDLNIASGSATTGSSTTSTRSRTCFT